MHFLFNCLLVVSASWNANCMRAETLSSSQLSPQCLEQCPGGVWSIFVEWTNNTWRKWNMQGWWAPTPMITKRHERLHLRAFLVAQWLRIRLPMQGTRVQALVQKDPTCRRATKPACHNYWVCALQPASHNYWSPHAYSPYSTTREATTMRSPHTSTKSSPGSTELEKARAQQQRPNAAKNK